jgi:hypothetical protein
VRLALVVFWPFWTARVAGWRYALTSRADVVARSMTRAVRTACVSDVFASRKMRGRSPAMERKVIQRFG